MKDKKQNQISRRDLLKMAAASSAGLMLSGFPIRVLAQDTVTLRNSDRNRH